jgi:hypothetical protein
MDILKKLFYSDSLPTFSTKEEMQDLLHEIKNQGEDWGPIWEIYFTLRWHIQSRNGDCLAKESLRIMRQELHPDTQLLDSVDPQTREVFEDFVRNSPTSFHGIQNRTIYGRQVFYPNWVVADSEGPYFSPRGSDLPPSAKGKIGGVRACCERALAGNSEESYPFRNPAFVADILAKSRAPIEESGEDSIRCKTLVDYLQRQIGEGDYDLLDYPSLYEKLGFLQDAIDLDDPIAMEAELDFDDLIAMEEDAGVSGGQQFCLPGVESVLASNFFHNTFAARHEMYPYYGFRLIAESDNTELQTYLAFALARMDFQKHLPEIFSKQCKNRSVGRDFEELPILFAIELMQAGHISKAVEMITAEGADEALLSGDKSLFTSIMCLPTALKKSREGSYCTVFAYACSRLPELLPDKDEQDKALNSLERFVFNDSFLVEHLHPAMMLCALIGAMLRSGEFDRADQLQGKLNSLTISKEIKNECGFFYLDAAVFWYLNGSVSNMIEVLSRLLSNHIQGVSQ